MTAAIALKPGQVALPELRAVWKGARATLAPQAYADIDAAADCVARVVASGRTVYGVNTGFGLLARERVSTERLAELQRNLVLSHACGLGPDLEPAIVRLIITLKAIGLARGRSGVRRAVVDQLLAFLDKGLIPAIPAQGSVGASGDLAPLAHLSAAMMGVGRVHVGARVRPAAEALAEAGLEPLTLGPKEGLALLNGTQVSTAIALDALFHAERVFAAALTAGAMSLDALKGSDAPFDARIHALRGLQGQIDVAAAMRALLSDSEIRASHTGCDKVQDPYSFRCQPQVMGAVLDVMRQVARTLETEANAVTDNPIVFPDADDILSGGNFHAQPVAFAADMLAMALCETGSLSERRLSALIDPALSGLPAFLVEDGGVNSGFMIPQVSAAALVSENKTLASPASVDSIPTSANQEDHVSMATGAARKARAIALNAAGVVGIEFLAAAQGVEFHRPLKSSPALEAAHAAVRARSAMWTRDRYWADELAAARDGVLEGALIATIEPALDPARLFN